VAANDLIEINSIDEHCDVLGIPAGQVRQQPLEVEMDVALPGLGFKRLLIDLLSAPLTIPLVCCHINSF